MQSACANMQAPFIFKSLHPGNDSSSLHNAQNMRQTRLKPIKFMKRLAVLAAPTRASCSHRLSNRVPSPSARQYHSFFPRAKHIVPVLIRHCVTLLSDPAPFPADWRPILCVSQSSDFVWQNWRATGPDQGEFSIEESASSACAAKHDRVTSVA